MRHLRGVSGLQASVIVRAKDRERTIGRTLESLHRQTVRPEVIVVDSGSQDATVSIARGACDRLIEIPPEEFTFGHALNLGAEAASAPIHFALSSHCAPERADWIERALEHYARDDVAGACGYDGLPRDGVPGGVVYQDLDMLRHDPFWGFTNHASSWRAEVWEKFPFDSARAGAEDKEWAARVLGAGYLIVLDPALDVATDHRFAQGVLDFYRRQRRDTRWVAEFAGSEPYGVRDLLSDWWNVRPDTRSRARIRLSPWHAADVLGRYAGLRGAPGPRL